MLRWSDAPSSGPALRCGGGRPTTSTKRAGYDKVRPPAPPSRAFERPQVVGVGSRRRCAGAAARSSDPEPGCGIAAGLLPRSAIRRLAAFVVQDGGAGRWLPDRRHKGRASAASPSCAASPADAIAYVCRKRRVDDLDRLEAGIDDAVEEPLTGAEQDGDDVEAELVDHAYRKRLPHRRRAAGDVDSTITCSLQRCQRCNSIPRRPRGCSRLWSGPATKPSSEMDM